MPIRVRIRRVGTSLGVILPKRELDLRRLAEGDEVEIGKLARVAPRELFGVWKDNPVRPGETSP